jgi:hypothetical protein
VKIAKKIKVKEIRMRDKSQKACQFVSLLIRFACGAILFLVASAIPMTNQAQTQQQRKPTDSVPIPEPAIPSIHGQTRSLADESGDLSKPIAPLPVGPEAGQTVRMSPALLRGDRVNGVPQKLGSMGTFQILLILHLSNGFVLLICFFSLGINNPWKWFQQTRMKNMK